MIDYKLLNYPVTASRRRIYEKLYIPKKSDKFSDKEIPFQYYTIKIFLLNQKNLKKFQEFV